MKIRRTITVRLTPEEEFWIVVEWCRKRREAVEAVLRNDRIR